MTVMKRSKTDSSSDLLEALAELIPLLKDQKEFEAADDLESIRTMLRDLKPGSDDYKGTIAKLVDAFEGEHELMAYTFQREGSEGKWTAVEQLSFYSSRVISLAKRMQ